MRTRWGELPVADAHVHFFSHNFFQLIGKYKGDLSAEDVADTLGWQAPPVDPVALAQIWIDEMDRFGIESAVMMASLPGDEDSVAAAVARFPERLRGYFFVNPLAPDALNRAGAALERGLRGMCFFPAMHAYSMHDPSVQPLIELAAARPGTVVFVHCGVLTVSIRKRLGLPSNFDMRFSNPIDLHAIALRYPGVTFVIPHFGAGYFREALMVAAMCPNICFDTSSSNAWMRYQTSPITLRQVFERALDVVGPRRLLFGSDSSFFPRGWHQPIFDEQAAVLRDIGLGAEEAVAIFGGNLRRILTQP